ncbi:MAG: hypothetical protein ACPG4K_13795, partial [Haloferula sp.]
MENYEKKRFAEKTHWIFKLEMREAIIKAMSSPLMEFLGGFVGGVIGFGFLFITTFLLPYLWWKHAERNHQTQLIAWGCVILPIACIYILRTDPTGIAEWWLS